MEYLVTFKSGRTKVMNGTIVLFDNSNLNVIRKTDEEVAYLNVNDVESIVGRPKKTGEE